MNALRTCWIAPGDRIQVVAPAGPFPLADFERGVQALRTRYEVVYHHDIGARSGYLAGDDARRLGELRAALHDDSVRAIVAARGGYGVTRLLDRLPAELVARHPKLLVGFSDITALHALWARAGLGSVHGPMVAALGRLDAAGEHALMSRWTAAVEGAMPAPIEGLTTLGTGGASTAGCQTVRGPLLGGNLAVLCALLGTPYLPPLDGCVLLLEDVGERPYRIDRMLTSLQLAGQLTRPAAIVLGAFTDAEPGPDGVAVDQVLCERLGQLGIPVLAGVPAGHVDDNLELPLGSTAIVDAARGTLCFEASPRTDEPSAP